MQVLRCASGAKSLEVLISTAGKLSCPCLLLSPEMAAGITGAELRFAFHFARHAFAGKRNLSGRLSNEALLFLSNQTNFSSAVEAAGAKTQKDFVLACEKSVPIARLRKLLLLTSAKKMTVSEWGRKVGHYSKGELAVERMALVRVRN
ncbi:MAG: hypothetical protein NT051_04250 [Candidatus Micrarchaeota archaeon]|nr:hypothetical protein [Candidatus Micrarchaeota archaeon]